jgi:hypothetical protein
MTLLQALLAIGCLLLFVWIFYVPSKKPMTKAELEQAEENHMIGALVGAMGGDFTDAAVARFALQRFEAQYKRKATPNDLGVLLGIISQS